MITKVQGNRVRKNTGLCKLEAEIKEIYKELCVLFTGGPKNIKQINNKSKLMYSKMSKFVDITGVELRLD